MKMALNYKSVGQKLLAVLLIVSFLTPFFYLPYQARKAQAFLGFGDITVDISAKIERIVDGFAMVLAQQMIDHMTQSTVKWAQSGFDGNPAYVTDAKQYFTDIADGSAGQYIKGSKLGFLCSPFQAQIRLSLAEQYTNAQPFQCTLTNVVGNIENFYDDFSQGGWDAWFSMTQTPTNNPYGAYLAAKIDLDSQVASALKLKEDDLNRNSGFISWSECVKKNPNPFERGTWEETGINPDYVDGKAEGECIERGPTKTPGSVIQAQLNEVLPGGLKKLQVAQHIDQLVSSFASGLLTRYVFGSKGLFASGPANSNTGNSDGGNGNRTGMTDLDGDDIPDGQDFDYDGKLETSVDVCLHGGRAPDCVLSAGVTSSPYFTPVCEAIDNGVAVLGEYSKFLDSHSDQIVGGSSLKGAIIGGILAGPVGVIAGIFGLGGGSGADNFKNKADADVWVNRTSEASSATDQIVSSIQTRYSSYFDEMETASNRFSNYMGKVLESLIKDKDLDLARRGNGGGGLENVMKHTAYNLRYFREVKAKLGKCEKPEISGIPAIPLPPEVPQEGGQCAVEGGVYATSLRSAMNAVLSDNPEVGDLPNIEEGGRQNARTFLSLVAEELHSRGFNATTEILNGNNNPSTGDIIGVWKEGETRMERYDAISGSAETIREAAITNFEGFVPLNCTSSGTGEKKCGCQSDTPGNGGGGTPGSPTNPGGDPGGGSTAPGAPVITNVSPATVVPGSSTLIITGTNLTTTVQFFDGSGGRHTVIGTLNSGKTEVRVLVPAELPGGNATVRVYKDASTVSNGRLISVNAPPGGGTGLSTVTPTSSWSPTQTTDNWYPAVSSDGRYVAYGNLRPYNTDLQTKTERNLMPAGETRCWGGEWIKSDIVSFVCEVSESAFNRYEYKVGEWIPRKTSDDPSLVAGNNTSVADGHWASWLATRPARIALDNKLYMTGDVWAPILNKNQMIYGCDSTSTITKICLATNGVYTKRYTPAGGTVFGKTLNNGYILYDTYLVSGRNSLRGITPSGTNLDLMVSPWGSESVGKVVFVNNAPWVLTVSYNNETGYLLLRPWGERDLNDVTAIRTVGGMPSIAYNNGVFTIATASDVGRMAVITVPYGPMGIPGPVVN